MHDRLSEFELEILRRLQNGEEVRIASLHRIRLEYAGAIREGANGIALTPHGHRMALQKALSLEPQSDASVEPSRRDSRGRRLPFQRRSVF